MAGLQLGGMISGMDTSSIVQQLMAGDIQKLKTKQTKVDELNKEKSMWTDIKLKLMEVKYAGKDLEFRQKNPRRFQSTNISNKMTILCDDLITTGATIKEAKKALEKKNNQVLFSLTLADAKL